MLVPPVLFHPETPVFLRLARFSWSSPAAPFSLAVWLGVGCGTMPLGFGLPSGHFGGCHIGYGCALWLSPGCKKENNLILKAFLTVAFIVSMVPSYFSILCRLIFSHINLSASDPGWQYGSTQGWGTWITLLMSVVGPFPWETFTYCVLQTVWRFGNGLCVTCLGLLVVMVAFPSSVLTTLPFSSEGFMVHKSRLTAHTSGFPVFSCLSPVENFLVNYF